MRRALVLLLVLLAPAAVRAREAAPETRAFVDVRPLGPAPFVGQAVTLRLRVGVDRAWFAQHAASLFKVALDVPVQVDAPWPGPDAGAARLTDAPSTRALEPEPLSFVLDGEVARGERLADETRDGRVYAVLAVDRRYHLAGPGPVRLPAATLRFAHAERFEEDFLGERVAVDPRFVTVRGPATEIALRPLPEADRPDGFAGVIGSYAVEARTAATTVDVGEAFELVVRIAGRGNLETFREPPLLGLESFRIQGRRDDQRPFRRTVTYELAALHADVIGTPAVALPYLDPAPAGGAYDVARSGVHPLWVRAPDGGEVAEEGPEGAEPPWWLHALLGVLVLLLGLLLVRAQRPRKAPAPASAEPDRGRVEAARAALEHGDVAPERAFVAWLAACLDCPEPAVVGPDLARRLVAARVPEALARRTADEVERLVAARYGGGGASVDGALVAALEAAFADGGDVTSTT